MKRIVWILIVFIFIAGCKKENELPTEVDDCAPRDVSAYKIGVIRGIISGTLTDGTPYSYPFNLKYEHPDQRFRSKLDMNADSASMILGKGNACGNYMNIYTGSIKLPFSSPSFDSSGTVDLVLTEGSDSTVHHIGFYTNDVKIIFTSYNEEKKIIRGTFTASGKTFNDAAAVITNGEFEIPFYETID
jgi:hypothetical protein